MIAQVDVYAQQRGRSERYLLGSAALLFAACSTLTIRDCAAMAAMPGMPMAGGWNMSMAWMRMPGQSWSGAAASFIGMWMTMMVPMMLPVLLPILLRYRRSVICAGDIRRDALTALVVGGYFAIWSICGIIIFALGVALAETAMRLSQVARALPIIAALTVLCAGALQFTAWKTQRLRCCRALSRGDIAAHDNFASAWLHGIRSGLQCGYCCGSLMAALLAIGVMDLYAMAAVTLAIGAERLLPRAIATARAIGVLFSGAGLYIFVQALADFSR